MPLLLRVLIVDVRAGADLGECETRLRTTTTLLPAASTIATSKKRFIARRRRRSSLGVPDAAEEADTPRYSTVSSLNHYLQNLIHSVLRRLLPSLLGAPLDLGWVLGSHSFLTSHSSSPPLVRECFAPPLAYLFVGECSQFQNFHKFTHFDPICIPSGEIAQGQMTSNRADIKIYRSYKIVLDIFLCD